MIQDPNKPSDEALERERRERKIVEALCRLQQNADFKVFIADGIIEPYLNQRDENEELQGDALIRGQGEARALRKILKRIDSSQQMYVRLRNREGQRVSQLMGIG